MYSEVVALEFTFFGSILFVVAQERATTTLTCPAVIQGIVERSSDDGCGLRVWFYIVYSSHLGPGENFTEAWEKTFPLQSIHELFVSTPRIAPIGGTIVEVNSKIQLHIKSSSNVKTNEKLQVCAKVGQTTT